MGEFKQYPPSVVKNDDFTRSILLNRVRKSK